MKLLMVGLGSMGKYHIKKFTALGFEIAGGVDTDPQAIEQAKVRYSIPWTGSRISDFHGEADAVSIAVPDSMHKDCYLEANGIGRPLFLEKPLTRSLADARYLNRNITVPCLVNFSKRNISALFVLKQMLDEGRLGEIQSMEVDYCQNWLSHDSMGDWREMDSLLWRISPLYSAGGCFADLGAHIVETLILLFGNCKFIRTSHIVTLSELVSSGKVKYRSTKDEKYNVLDKPKDGQPMIPVEYEGLFESAGIPCRIKCSFISDIYNEATIIQIHGSKASAVIDTSKDRKNVMINGFEAVGGKEAISTYQMFSYLASGRTDLLPEDRPTLDRAVEVQKVLEEVLR
jgi:predicted dehydrogenase